MKEAIKGFIVGTIGICLLSLILLALILLFYNLLGDVGICILIGIIVICMGLSPIIIEIGTSIIESYKTKKRGK